MTDYFLHVFTVKQSTNNLALCFEKYRIEIFKADEEVVQKTS